MDNLIIIPTYNEAENIGPLSGAVLETVPKSHVLFVDDSSPDGTAETVRRLAQRDPRIRLLTRPPKAGFGKAYKSGFAYALERDYSCIVQMDADFSHPPEKLPEMLVGLGESDLVIGSRYVAGGSVPDWDLGRRCLSRVGNLYARVVLRLGIQDMTAGFMAWKGTALRQIPIPDLRCEGYAFLIELKLHAFCSGLRIRELPICFRDRRVGQSKMEPRIAVEAVSRVWGLRRLR